MALQKLSALIPKPMHSIAEIEVPGLLGRIPEHRRRLLFVSFGNLPAASKKIIPKEVNRRGSFQTGFSFEPSEIFLELPVSPAKIGETVPPLGYFPTYQGMTPNQRFAYIDWLSDTAQLIDTGYVFTYYYGLERHLIYGDFDGAFDEIQLLRRHHKNKSFRFYSASALTHACLIKNNLEKLQSLYSEDGFEYFGSSSMLLLHHQRLDLTPEILIKVAAKIDGVNMRYIKDGCAYYLQALKAELTNRFGKESYPFADRYQLSDIKGVSFALFANVSIPMDVREPPLPCFFRNGEFARDMRNLFTATHESAKVLRQANRRSKTQEEKPLAIERK